MLGYRPVSPTEPLHVYSWLDAVGNTLLPAMEVMQACESEVVISCVELLPLADTQGERPGRTATTRISSPGGEVRGDGRSCFCP